MAWQWHGNGMVLAVASVASQWRCVHLLPHDKFHTIWHSMTLVVACRIKSARAALPAPQLAVMPKWPLRRSGEAASSNAGLPSDSAASAASQRRCSSSQRPASQRPSSAASQRPAKRTGEELAKLVGPVTESREQHLRRHKNGMKSCPRCRYYSRLDTWTRSYGHVKEAASAGPRNLVWLAERPTHYGGTWALGCLCCARTSVMASTGESLAAPIKK